MFDPLLQYSNDGHKLNHRVLSPCTKVPGELLSHSKFLTCVATAKLNACNIPQEQVRSNLATNPRVTCLSHPPAHMENRTKFIFCQEQIGKRNKIEKSYKEKLSTLTLRHLDIVAGKVWMYL